MCVKRHRLLLKSFSSSWPPLSQVLVYKCVHELKYSSEIWSTVVWIVLKCLLWLFLPTSFLALLLNRWYCETRLHLFAKYAIIFLKDLKF